MTERSSDDSRVAKGDVASGLTVRSSLRWSMVDIVLQQAVRFAVTVVLTRLVAPSEFGLIAMALVFVQLASLIGDLGLGPALVQRKVVERIHVTTATVATALFGVVLAVLLIACAAPIASLYGEERLVPVLQVLGLTYVLRGIAGVPRDLIRKAMRFDLFALASGIAIGVSGAIALVLAFRGAGVWALVLQVLIEAVLAAVCATTLAWKIGVWKPGWRVDVRVLKELLGFGVFVSGSRIGGYAASNIDNFIVGKVLGALALGLYNLAYRLMLFPILKVADVVASVTMPALSVMQDNRQALVNAHRKTIALTFALCMPASVGIAVAAPVLIPAVFGAAWLPAVGCVQVLALNGVRLVLNRLNGSVFQATGRPMWDFGVTAVTFVLYLVGFLATVQHGIVAVAWAFTVAGHLVVPLDLYLLRRAVDERLWSMFRDVVPSVVATLVMAAVGFVVLRFTAQLGYAPRALLVVVGSCVAYATVLRLLSPSVIGEFRALARRS